MSAGDTGLGVLSGVVAEPAKSRGPPVQPPSGVGYLGPPVPGTPSGMDNGSMSAAFPGGMPGASRSAEIRSLG